MLDDSVGRGRALLVLLERAGRLEALLNCDCAILLCAREGQTQATVVRGAIRVAESLGSGDDLTSQCIKLPLQLWLSRSPVLVEGTPRVRDRHHQKGAPIPAALALRTPCC
jgi:hypothetical protein